MPKLKKLKKVAIELFNDMLVIDDEMISVALIEKHNLTVPEYVLVKEILSKLRKFLEALGDDVEYICEEGYCKMVFKSEETK